MRSLPSLSFCSSRAIAKVVKNYKKQKKIETESELALTLYQAELNSTKTYELNPKRIVPIRYEEEMSDSLASVVGGETAETIDWTQALERLAKEKDNEY